MNRFGAFRAAVWAAVIAVGAAACPANAQTTPGGIGLPDVPTTRVLAIGHLSGTSTTAGLSSLMAQEVGDTVRLYLSGKIAEWYVRKDQPGVVFVLDVRTAAEARALLDGLPLGRSGLMAFDLMPLGPLAPLGQLLPKP